VPLAGEPLERRKRELGGPEEREPQRRAQPGTSPAGDAACGPASARS
jgi:hypothetical protein